VKTLEQRFATTLAKNNHLHGRDEALFLLAFKADDKPSKQRALKLAETNWKTQKEPDDTITLLRAIIANKDSSKQHIITDWVKKHAVQDQRLASLLSLK
jgi:hypothetical protein